MNVRELIKHLQAFDNELPVVVVDRFDYNHLEVPVDNVVWENDGKCKIVIDYRR